ncbi:nucleoside-specific channel-forming protein Tsx [Phytohalomonas tamaricis]|uniref:nucleoside-specific channel-forming protein Tsx n=1 Tax=Phytohalomonas tamaricis TaxID=2081032 RepID=UPI000D0AFDEB|nr:nucleoside-specific channel-forming protein Tsx [Phytohalomonas tamaricis]
MTPSREQHNASFYSGKKSLTLSSTLAVASLYSIFSVTPAVLAQESTAQGRADTASGETASYEITEDEPRSEYLSDWYNQNLTIIGDKNIRFGPQPVDDIYLEYEFFGRKGPLELYGYVDLPKFFGIGNSNDTGIWDDGSPLFTELEPRLSIDGITGKDLSVGPFKEWFFAVDYIFDWGHNSDSRQNTLYAGFGTDIDTHTPVALSFNLYKRYQWENYGAANENSWDGYRAQAKYVWPLGQFSNGASLTYVGFTNYDFGSDLRDDAGPMRTNEAVVATNVLLYSFTHLRFMGVARYFHNGGQWKDDVEADFGEGAFHLRSTGWGYYFGVGWQF